MIGPGCRGNDALHPEMAGNLIKTADAASPAGNEYAVHSLHMQLVHQRPPGCPAGAWRRRCQFRRHIRVPGERPGILDRKLCEAAMRTEHVSVVEHAVPDLP